MKICVVGLGLIGGSICKSLKRAGYYVAGWNRSSAVSEYALKNNIIDETAENFTAYDIVFVALPPEATVRFIDSNDFSDGAIVSDICGVKSYITEAVRCVPRNFRYVGCHPMAGKEVSGIENSCADLFDRASMIICCDEKTDPSALETIRNVVRDMGFLRLVECSPEVHDRKIAYTSQLAHIVSNAYVKDDEMNGCLGFTGGSFQDMTRIAGVDECVWASLYLKNAANLSEKIGSLISSLQEIKRAIDEGERENVEEVLREGRLRFESGKNKESQSCISVKNLK